MPPIRRPLLPEKVNLVVGCGLEEVQMEAGLRIRRIWEVDRSRRLYRGLYEVAEVAFMRAGSQKRHFGDLV